MVSASLFEHVTCSFSHAGSRRGLAYMYVSRCCRCILPTGNATAAFPDAAKEQRDPWMPCVFAADMASYGSTAPNDGRPEPCLLSPSVVHERLSSPTKPPRLSCKLDQQSA